MLKRLLTAAKKWSKARKDEEVQEILDRVINTSGYEPMPMCSALKIAKQKRLVSEKEYKTAFREIEKYLLPTARIFLMGALKQEGLPHSREDCLRVYRDWKNRPKLTPLK